MNCQKSPSWVQVIKTSKSGRVGKTGLPAAFLVAMELAEERASVPKLGRTNASEARARQKFAKERIETLNVLQFKTSILYRVN